MEPKTLLHHSLCQYLQNNGFSKTLHKFLSEAKINQDDGWKDGSLDLEEVYYKCLLTRDCIASVETASKTKKKKSDKSDRNAVDNQCQEKDQISNGKKSEEIVTSDLVPESAVISKKEKKIKTTSGSIKEVAEQVRSDVLTESANDIVNEPLVEKKCKDKKKKKVKSGSEFLVDTLDDHQNEAQPTTTKEKCATDSEISMKPKDKKKKKEKLVSDHTDNNEQCGMGDKQWVTKCMDEEADSVKSKGKKKRKVDLVLESLPDKSMDELDKSKSRNNSQKDDFQTSEDAAINKESKESKKRKRLASEDNNSQPIDKVAVEKSKRRKTEGMEESQPNMQLKELDASLESDGHAGKGSKEQNGKVCFNDSQERAINHLDTHSNGNLERHEENLSVQKSSKKQHNGSVEPKTVNAFQRVKIDKVVFTDERLQDNSYWAKDGAEIGYGAKAQEVLGQVRGRDFRHEKTKKKRGSYRGGQIDLHSHSVKFNYSDED